MILVGRLCRDGYDVVVFVFIFITYYNYERFALDKTPKPYNSGIAQ